jgi:hypothetical protein
VLAPPVKVCKGGFFEKPPASSTQIGIGDSPSAPVGRSGTWPPVTHPDEPIRSLAKVVNLANRSDANRNRLEPHEPKPTDVPLTLGAREGDIGLRRGQTELAIGSYPFFDP